LFILQTSNFTLFSLVIRTFFAILLCFFVVPLWGQQAWVLKKDVDSIKVYTGYTEDSDFKSIKAEFTVHASLSGFAAMVWNVERYIYWQYNTTDAKVLKVINDHELIYHAAIEAPWPVSDRDMVVKMKMSQDTLTKALTISTIGIPSYIPDVDSRVRVPMSKAQWVVTPVSKTTLRVVYIIHIDPGGAVPAWMVNMVCVEAPYESFLKMRMLIGREKNRPLDFIVD
jgi:hypothetical protein